MLREEAVSCLKEIIASTSYLSPSAVSLVKSSSKQVSPAYQILLKGSIAQEDKRIISNIAQKHNMAIDDKNNELVIYKPETIGNLV
jgi:hypothetical protein